MLIKIISGGQTGANQAGLDAAIALNFPHGGWIPKGRLTENGPLSEKYHLQEMATDKYSKRTEQNVIDSDATVIFSHGKLTGGSGFTRKMAVKHNKPWLHLDLDAMSVAYASRLLKSWIIDNGIKVLNVAGPRGSGTDWSRETKQRRCWHGDIQARSQFHANRQRTRGNEGKRLGQLRSGAG